MKKQNVVIACIFSATLIIISLIGGWVYVSKLNSQHREKELTQQRELAEKEMKRKSLEKQIETDCAFHSTTSFGEPISVQNNMFGCADAKEQLKNL